MGFALGSHDNFEFYSYFLNASNHATGSISIDGISYHLYVMSDSAVTSADLPAMYKDQVRAFIEESRRQIEAIKAGGLHPGTTTMVSEIGCTADGELHGRQVLACVQWNAHL